MYFSLYTGAVKEVYAAEDPGNPKAIGGILIIESVRIPELNLNAIERQIA